MYVPLQMYAMFCTSNTFIPAPEGFGFEIRVKTFIPITRLFRQADSRMTITKSNDARDLT